MGSKSLQRGGTSPDSAKGSSNLWAMNYDPNHLTALIDLQYEHTSLLFQTLKEFESKLIQK